MSEPLRTTLLGVGEVEYAVTGRVRRILPAARPLPERIDHAGAAFPVAGAAAALEDRKDILVIREPGLRRLVGLETRRQRESEREQGEAGLHLSTPSDDAIAAVASSNRSCATSSFSRLPRSP